MKRRAARQSGFSLVELMIAMVVLVVGSLGVASLVIYGIRLQDFSAHSTQAAALAKAKVEQLRVTDAADPTRSLGGSMTSDVPDHFDTPPGGSTFVRRWVIAQGPAGTQQVTVTVVSISPEVRIAPVQIQTLLSP